MTEILQKANEALEEINKALKEQGWDQEKIDSYTQKIYDAGFEDGCQTAANDIFSRI